MRSRKTMIYTSLLLICLLLSSCGSSVVAIPPTLIEPEAGSIETVFVTRGVVEALTVLPGITRAPTVTANLKHIEAGYGHIGAIYAFPGDIVSQGQILARLETPELDEKIKKLEESIELALALNELYLDEISTQIRLFGQGGASGPQARLLRLDRQYAIARHELEMAELEKQLEILYFEKEQTEVVAPIDGELVHIVPFGGLVYAMDIVAYITGPGSILIEHIGDPNVSWNFVLLQAEIDGKTYDIHQVYYSSSEYVMFRRLGIEPLMRFEISGGSPDMLSAGEPVFIKGYTAFVEDTLRIPENAVYRDRDGSNFVYLLRDGEQELVYVTIGVATNIFVQILDGLDEGDEVVVRQ